MSVEVMKEKGLCCACGTPLRSSKRLNIVALNKKATWEFPTWGNILVPESTGRAAAVFCDSCIDKKAEPKYAVELKDERVIYHKFEELEDVFSITKEMVEEGERKMMGTDPSG